LETLITAQLANHYGVRFLSTAAFRLLNADHRFVVILDGFDEMKFAMAPNDFNHISAQIRNTAAVNSKLLLLGRPDSIESEEEETRLTSSRFHALPLKADSAPDFDSLRLAFLSKEEYLIHFWFGRSSGKLAVRKIKRHVSLRTARSRTSFN
jgi:hypothetical protein